MKPSSFVLMLLLSAVGFLSSCEKPNLSHKTPTCIEEKIEFATDHDNANPISVSRWKIDGKTYYYLQSDCCDQFNVLVDEDCKEVCAPDGGFSGQGDGNCPNWSGEIEKTVIWTKE